MQQERLQRQSVRDDTACSDAPRDSQQYYTCRHDLVVAREQAAAQAPAPDIGARCNRLERGCRPAQRHHPRLCRCRSRNRPAATSFATRWSVSDPVGSREPRFFRAMWFDGLSRLSAFQHVAYREMTKALVSARPGWSQATPQPPLPRPPFRVRETGS